jgi:hypothetical protein
LHTAQEQQEKEASAHGKKPPCQNSEGVLMHGNEDDVQIMCDVKSFFQGIPIYLDTA